ncbi:uncharacterized protein LOC129947568 [Eupeodes corollae]|uniref:uncharacterized protein LOC129947568 n=1 Tax=Eupeodes corollae TaxID=290404 RepID=UPI00249309D4|nr:uncharacterized protein LOC129947568 [Eupeodes corollae]XP_055914159.1 uncharacterized protein LOC129947568 [Eupeodes corollae]
MDSPKMVFIDNTPKDPVEMFSNILKAYKTAKPEELFIPMSISTIDDEFGTLNRTIVYRGLVDGDVIFVSERNSVKYANLIKDPRIAACFLLCMKDQNGIDVVWQIRIMGKAVELPENQIANLYTEEPVYAKIRNRINVSGKPVNFAEQKAAFDKLLKQYEDGQDSLPQTNSYTAFKIVPTVWDFYKSEPNSIADRVQYRKGKSNDEKWSVMHVAS